jgi:hypothetical protein
MHSGAKDGEDDRGEGEEEKAADLAAAFELLGDRSILVGLPRSGRVIWH